MSLRARLAMDQSGSSPTRKRRASSVAPSAARSAETKDKPSKRQKVRQAGKEEDEEATRVDVQNVFEDDLNCPICLELMVGCQIINPCGHMACGICSDQWITQRPNPTCHTCREPASLLKALIPCRGLDSIIEKHIAVLEASGAGDGEWGKEGGKRKDWDRRMGEWTEIKNRPVPPIAPPRHAYPPWLNMLDNDRGDARLMNPALTRHLFEEEHDVQFISSDEESDSDVEIVGERRAPGHPGAFAFEEEADHPAATDDSDDDEEEEDNQRHVHLVQPAQMHPINGVPPEIDQDPDGDRDGPYEDVEYDRDGPYDSDGEDYHDAPDYLDGQDEEEGEYDWEGAYDHDDFEDADGPEDVDGAEDDEGAEDEDGEEDEDAPYDMDGGADDGDAPYWVDQEEDADLPEEELEGEHWLAEPPRPHLQYDHALADEPVDRNRYDPALEDDMVDAYAIVRRLHLERSRMEQAQHPLHSPRSRRVPTPPSRVPSPSRSAHRASAASALLQGRLTSPPRRPSTSVHRRRAPSPESNTPVASDEDDAHPMADQLRQLRQLSRSTRRRRHEPELPHGPLLPPIIRTHRRFTAGNLEGRTHRRFISPQAVFPATPPAPRRSLPLTPPSPPASPQRAGPSSASPRRARRNLGRVLSPSPSPSLSRSPTPSPIISSRATRSSTPRASSSERGHQLASPLVEIVRAVARAAEEPPRRPSSSASGARREAHRAATGPIRRHRASAPAGTASGSGGRSRSGSLGAVGGEVVTVRSRPNSVRGLARRIRRREVV